MKKLAAIIVWMICLLNMCACSNKVQVDYYLEELPETNIESIGNVIPEWVENTNWTKKFYTETLSDIALFDAYALENFPSMCDAQWTQEQSDKVYLGRGIKLFILDNSEEINSIVYYPVILNGVIVSFYQIYSNNGELVAQLSPAMVNQFNSIMDLTSQTTPLILGINNNNVIAIIGNKCFVLDEDHMLHRQVDLSAISDFKISNCVNVMEILCNDRKADVNDWTMID